LCKLCVCSPRGTLLSNMTGVACITVFAGSSSRRFFRTVVEWLGHQEREEERQGVSFEDCWRQGALHSTLHLCTHQSQSCQVQLQAFHFTLRGRHPFLQGCPVIVCVCCRNGGHTTIASLHSGLRPLLGTVLTLRALKQHQMGVQMMRLVRVSVIESRVFGLCHSKSRSVGNCRFQRVVVARVCLRQRHPTFHFARQHDDHLLCRCVFS
jgi:hypothetical protein